MARVPQTAERDRLRAEVEAAAHSAFTRSNCKGRQPSMLAIARSFAGRGVSEVTAWRWVQATMKGLTAQPTTEPPDAAEDAGPALQARYSVLARELARVRAQRDAALAELATPRRGGA